MPVDKIDSMLNTIAHNTQMREDFIANNAQFNQVFGADVGLTTQLRKRLEMFWFLYEPEHLIPELQVLDPRTRLGCVFRHIRGLFEELGYDQGMIGMWNYLRRLQRKLRFKVKAMKDHRYVIQDPREASHRKVSIEAQYELVNDQLTEITRRILDTLIAKRTFVLNRYKVRSVRF